MSNRINGQRGAFLQPVRFGRDQQGPYSELTHVGTREEVQALAQALNMNTGAVFDVQASFSGAADRLSARLPWSYGIAPSEDDVVIQWEFFAQAVEKDLLDADLPWAESDSPLLVLTGNDKRAIRYALANQPNEAVAETSPAFTGADNAAECYEVYKMMTAGFRSIRVNAPTLRLTQIINQQSPRRASLDNVSRIVTTDYLWNAYWKLGIRGAVFDLPIDVPYTPTDGIAKNYGWFWHHPTTRQVAWGKWQIVTEWEYGLWVEAAYGIPL